MKTVKTKKREYASTFKNVEVAKKANAISVQKKKELKKQKEEISSKLGETWEQRTAELMKAKIEELLNSDDKKTQMEAIRYFGDYIMPKKREITGRVLHAITFVCSPDLLPDSEAEISDIDISDMEDVTTSTEGE